MDNSQHLCPYLERRDFRCSSVLTLTNLREALGRCAGGHEYCSTYHRIRVEDLEHRCAALPVAKSA